MELTKVEQMKITRQRKRLTLTKVADSIGTDRSNLSKYEKEYLPFPAYVWEAYSNYIADYSPEK
ncbi:helix-turn-helix domain-containing protein [Virgibacillus halodenitrificans]|uniref:Helix-turn-helix transcriptional regulator n=1 Tax=Virgibacillus halodenitrificans TaxID=1482 RepID=A0ABR7VPQ5_VIRHA|nr:helix-turn-helix transcriptional regulator [Virgibacillus halodenitrificans]MBD1222782.1 helix-turn-helix transcriptional regulator [Virgibacillus halodenitrificans]